MTLPFDCFYFQLVDDKRARRFLHPTASGNSTSVVCWERKHSADIVPHIESFQVIAIEARRKASSAARCEPIHRVRPRVCMRGRGMHASWVYACLCVCVCMLRAYILIHRSVDGERVRARAYASRAAAQYAVSKHLCGRDKSIWLSLIK